MKKILIITIMLFSLYTMVSAQWSIHVSISPVAVSASLNESMGSCIGISGDTIHVVWTDKLSTTRARIYYTRSLDTGLTWSTPIVLSDTGGNAWNPAIAVNGKNIHVVWRMMKPAGGMRASWYKHSLDGGNTWGTDVFLDSTADWPAVAVSGKNVYMANDSVTAASPYNTEIFFMRSTDNGLTWSHKQRLTFAVGRSEDEAIHAEGSHIHMSWNDNRVGLFQILYKESNDYGVTWSTDTVVVDPIKDYNTMVWSDSAHVDVIAAGAPSGRYQLLIAQSSDTGATWGPSTDLSNDTAHTYFLPDMVRNGSDLHVVCNSSGGAKYFHSGDGGATWDSPVTLPGVSFVAYSGCSLHIIYVSSADHHIYYLRNPTGNDGHCGGVFTGIYDYNKTEQVNVYPNPATDNLTIEATDIGSMTYELRISDVVGNTVLEQTLYNKKTTINISSFSKDVYFVEIRTEKGVVVKKFIKE